MLLANMAVSHRINDFYPDKALLRRHPPPQEKMLENLVGSYLKAESAYEYKLVKTLFCLPHVQRYTTSKIQSSHKHLS